MIALNGEGIQVEKIPFIKFIKSGKTILDLGSGIKIPYAGQLIKRLPKFIYFLDNRFKFNKKNKFSEVINENAFTYLNKKYFDYIWASEFMEHIDPKKQQQLFKQIKNCCRKYIITFPTTNHFNFHNDPDHRPVIIPHTAYKVNANDWEGIITNVPEIINYIKEFYEVKYYVNPPKVISKKRELAGLGI